jgi:hypothetical protein
MITVSSAAMRGGRAAVTAAAAILVVAACGDGVPRAVDASTPAERADAATPACG